MNEKNQLQIELSAEVAEGIYSNLAVITHSSSEFVVDFIRIMPGIPKAPVKSRIVLTPEHAKRLMFALQENIIKYESNSAISGLPNLKTIFLRSCPPEVKLKTCINFYPR